MEEGWRNVRHGKHHHGVDLSEADQTNIIQGGLAMHGKTEERWIEATVGGRMTLIRNPAYVSEGVQRFVKSMSCSSPKRCTQLPNKFIEKQSR